MSLVRPTCRGAGFLSQILGRGTGDDRSPYHLLPAEWGPKGDTRDTIYPSHHWVLVSPCTSLSCPGSPHGGPRGSVCAVAHGESDRSTFWKVHSLIRIFSFKVEVKWFPGETGFLLGFPDTVGIIFLNNTHPSMFKHIHFLNALTDRSFIKKGFKNTYTNLCVKENIYLQ